MKNLPFALSRLGSLFPRVKLSRGKTKTGDYTRVSIYPRKIPTHGPYTPMDIAPGEYLSTDLVQPKRNITLSELHNYICCKGSCCDRIREKLPKKGYLDHDCEPGHCSDNPLYGPSSPRLEYLGEN